MHDKRIIKAKGGFIDVPEGYYTKSLKNGGFLLSKTHGKGFEKTETIPVTRKYYASFVINDDNDMFIRRASQSEVNTRNLVFKKKKSSRVYGAECYITKQNYLRMQTDQLRVIGNNDLKGFWVFTMHLGERNYIEMSFQKSKGKLKTYREAVADKGYSVIELPKVGELDLKFYSDSVTSGYSFPLPRIFMQRANVEKGMYLDWHYSDDFKKIIIEEPAKICPVCQKAITLNTERKDVFMSSSVERALQESSYRQEFDSIKERLAATITYYESEINAVKSMIEAI